MDDAWVRINTFGELKGIGSSAIFGLGKESHGIFHEIASRWNGVQDNLASYTAV
jgi:hypothetical protein